MPASMGSPPSHDEPRPDPVRAGIRPPASGDPALIRYSPRMTRTTTSIPPNPTPHEQLSRRGATLVPSTPVERAELLDATNWSSRFAWKQIETLAHYLRCYQLRPGTHLFREGDHDAFLAIVVEGSLEIRKQDLAEADRIVARVGRGKIVGEMSLLDGASRSATGVAAEPTVVLVLGEKEFHDLGVDQPALALDLTLAIALTIAQLLRQTTGALVEHLEA